MKSSHRPALVVTLLVAGIVVAIFLSLAWRVEHQAKAETRREFSLDIDFDRFRQILVRTDATASIVEHAGMKLVENSIATMDVDLSNDPRPLRNAIRGVSHANVLATKKLKVQLNNNELNANELDLVQNAQIHPNEILVTTESEQPTGNLQAYRTTLSAVRDGPATSVTLTHNVIVNVRVSPLFVGIADAKVEEGALRSVEEQEQALRELVHRYADQRVILPKVDN
jgi:hypothetical protein